MFRSVQSQYHICWKPEVARIQAWKGNLGMWYTILLHVCLEQGHTQYKYKWNDMDAWLLKVVWNEQPFKHILGNLLCNLEDIGTHNSVIGGWNELKS